MTNPLLKQTFQDMNKIFGNGRKITRKRGEMIEASIAGIPCTVEVQHHKAYFAAREKGSGFRLEPDEPAHNEIINIFKRGGKGKHMQWLENKMTDEERERIERGE